MVSLDEILIESIQNQTELSLERMKLEHLSIIKEDKSILMEANTRYLTLFEKEMDKLHKSFGNWYKDLIKSYKKIDIAYKELKPLINSNKNKLCFDNLMMTISDRETHIDNTDRFISILREVLLNIDYSDLDYYKNKAIIKKIDSIINVNVKGFNKQDKKVHIFCYGKKKETLVDKKIFNQVVYELNNSRSNFNNYVKRSSALLDILYDRAKENIEQMSKNNEVLQNNRELQLNYNVYLYYNKYISSIFKAYFSRLNECILVVTRVLKNKPTELSEGEILFSESIENLDILSYYGFDFD